MIPLPLKQGLKHAKNSAGKRLENRYDSTSTKTRIETWLLVMVCF